MIDEKILQKYYGDVPVPHLDHFRSFLRSHTLKQSTIDGTAVPYYACGRGERALVIFCGGHSTPYTVWENIETYEADHRVLVLDISGFGTVGALSSGINQVLDHEGVDRVVLLGASLAGLIAQIYLKHNLDRVDGTVLINTMALRPESNKPLSLLLTKAMPGFLLRSLFRKKLRGYFREALEDPRSAEGARFGLAHLDEVMAEHFTKRKLINLLSVLFEFGREGFTRDDLAEWRGRALVVSSEDDPGFKDLEWLVENLPNSASHTFPAGLGHLPQLAHREKFESLIRGFVAQLDE